MDGFNPMLESFHSDDRFSTGAVSGSDASGASMKYWNVELVEGMEWEESEENGVYRADFYGTVAGERILLYTIRLGADEDEARTVIGSYRTDDGVKAVSIESYPLEPGENWTEVDMMTAGTMMDTVNSVMTAITASENFSSRTPGF